MSFIYLLFFYLMTTLVASDENRMEYSRKPRFLTFDNTKDDIDVNLDFNLPFIKIPLKTDSNSAFGELGLPTVNFNPTTIAIGATVVLVAAVLSTVFSNAMADQRDDRYGRQDDMNYMTDAFLEIANIVMSNGQNCPSRIACWISRNSSREDFTTWTKITRNKLLTTMFNTTAIENAYITGMNGGDCRSFTPCPLDEDQYSQYINSFSKRRRSQLTPVSPVTQDLSKNRYRH